MAILEHTGVVVPHDDMLGRLEAAGAKVSRSETRARIPEKLVMSLIKGAGKAFTLYGRDLSRTASFGRGKRNYNSIGGEGNWLDTVGGPRRFAALGDVSTAARFSDAMENINLVGAMADPHEVPAEFRCVAVLAEMIRNTVKPVTFWFHDRASAKYIVDMLVALRGGEKEAAEYPLCYPFLEPISPLRFPFNGVDLLYEICRVNMPVSVGPMAQMGLSAPATVAGTIAQETAEVLAGIVMVQLVKPGLPVCFGGICHAFDMRTTQMVFSGPEQAIFGVAMTQMGKHYGLPVYVNAGLTDSKRPDAQAGLESGMTMVLAAAAGADIFGHMGICGVDQATSLDMLTLQNEIIGYVESVMRRVEVTAETLALDVIDSAGPGGNFIDTEHTVEHFRAEAWMPKLLDRDYFDTWMQGGRRSMEERCRERKEKVLSTHSAPEVSPALDRALGEIVAAARSALLKR